MRVVLSLGTLFLVVSSASAHDFWLEPATFHPMSGRPVAIRLLVGDGFARESERSFDRAATIRFQARRGVRTVALLASGREGKSPFVEVSFEHPGQHWLGLERSRKTIRLEAEKFNDYLVEEGLDRI